MKGIGKDSSNLSKKRGAGCLVLFALPFAGVGVFMTYMLASSLLFWVNVQAWVEVPCEILSAELKKSSGSESTTYQAVARYKYQWDGTEYEHNRVGIHSGNDNIGSFQQEKARELIKLHKQGKEFRCYVNPSDPQQAILYRDARLGMMAFKGMFGLVFGLAGFGMLGFGIWNSRHQKRRSEFAKEHPNEPWLWRDDWAEGVVRDAPWLSVIGVGVMATLWNAISWGAALSFYFSDEELPLWVLAIIIGFPLIGAGLIVWAVYYALRALRWGSGKFELATVPGLIGGRLAGVVHAPRRLEPEEGFLVTLTCYETHTRSTGKGTENYQSPVWATDRLIGRSLHTGRDDTTAIPVNFHIPYEQPPTDDEKGISWKLKVEAEVPGVDYHSEFEVPVFKTAQSSPDAVPDDAVLAAYETPQSLETVLGRCHGRLLVETPTRLEIELPMARNWRLALPMTLFTIIWCGVSAGLIYSDAPLLFRIVFPGSAILVLLGTIWIWLERVKIAVDSFKVDVQGGLFGLGRLRRTPREEIESIVVEPSGTTSGNTVYQQVALDTKSLGKRKVMSGIARPSDGEAIAEVIRRTLGMTSRKKPKADSGLNLEIDLSASNKQNTAD